ncbi:hypothetical protein [Nocardioides coralli]|uniref:hypothetical protein n=1 Tax=Nocardioides coralli TaxID=2872154 RepID=UPI001CA3A452|nr:hypothetical protein [Nocardioides coralli]QZY28405.1 hypothetical protein K6T13_13135 [Nocardioides coralli]
MTSTHKTLIGSAILAGLLPLVGNGLYDGGDSSGTAVLRQAEEGLPTIAYAAYSLELAGFVALCVLLGCLATLIGRRSPVAAVTTVVVGTTAVAVKVASVTPEMALRVHHDGLDPAVAELMAGLNGAGFVVFGFLLSVTLTAAGIGLLRTDEPRWLAWWAAVVGGLGAVAGVVGILEPARYVPVPFLLLLLWMMAYGLTTAVRPTRRMTVATPVPATQ